MQGKIYFGFGIAPSMFPEYCTIRRAKLSLEMLKDILRVREISSCLNPSHAATIEVMRKRFGLEVEIPAKAPVVSMKNGDAIIVMGVSGLPRLEGRHEYTDEEIEKAEFGFSIFNVSP